MKNIYHEGKLINKAGVDRVVLSHVELKKINWPVFKKAITASSDIIYDAFRSANRTYYVTEGGDRLHYMTITDALFWCNHDQPRIVSRFGNEGEYWKESAKMLAGMIHLMRGTPYIYQGEEIGMTNPHYTSIEQYADVESRNYYEILLNEGKTKEEALEILAARSRDNSRTPMQWTDERYCGFSDTKPWIPVSDNFEKSNVKKQKQDRDSILEFYKKLIMLRKEKEVIARGNIEFMEVENAGVLAYTRCLDKQKLLVCCNFRDVESQMEFTQEWKSGRKILGNYEENHKNNYKVLTLRPYEIIVLEKGEE